MTTPVDRASDQQGKHDVLVDDDFNPTILRAGMVEQRAGCS
jgi:hypothetical protein